MKRITLITSIMLVAAPGAFAQSDEGIIETIRTSAAQNLLEQMPDELPESFLNSGLSPSDIERLMLQLANEALGGRAALINFWAAFCCCVLCR